MTDPVEYLMDNVVLDVELWPDYTQLTLWPEFTEEDE